MFGIFFPDEVFLSASFSGVKLIKLAPGDLHGMELESGRTMEKKRVQEVYDVWNVWKIEVKTILFLDDRFK